MISCFTNNEIFRYDQVMKTSELTNVQIFVRFMFW